MKVEITLRIYFRGKLVNTIHETGNAAAVRLLELLRSGKTCWSTYIDDKRVTRCRHPVGCGEYEYDYEITEE